MIEDAQQMDPDTGEMFPETISEQAIAAGNRSRAIDQMVALGTGKAHLYAAMMAAVRAMPVWITTDKQGAHNVKYATLKTILEEVRPILLTHGIRIRQGSDRSWPLDEGGGNKGRLVPVYTDLIHAESGEVDRTTIEIPLTRMDAQAMGSAITYGRRYSLLAALGLAVDEADDDGQSALPAKITDVAPDSPDLAALKKEIDAFKSGSDLAEWAREPKQEKRFSRMSEADLALARAYYKNRGQDILSAFEDDTPPAKGKSK